MTYVRIDRGCLPEQIRLPLARVAADEAVKILETHTDRPLVERPGLARLEVGRVVVLTEPGCAVAVVAQNCADGGYILADEAVVAWEAGGLFGHYSETGCVMVAPGDERRAAGRAERCRIHVRVTQAHLRQPVEGRRGDYTAERARSTEPRIVCHDQQDVGGTLRRHDAGRPIRLRLQCIRIDLAGKRRRR